MKTKQQGFTLIELMIVVAIIGILAAIALPAYQDYIARAKVSEAMAHLASAKTSVAEYTATNGALPTSSAEAGITTPTNTEYVSELGMTAEGDIAVTVTGTGAGIDTKHIIMTPTLGTTDNSVSWSCGTDAGADAKYAPSNCRATKTFTAYAHS